MATKVGRKELDPFHTLEHKVLVNDELLSTEKVLDLEHAAKGWKTLHDFCPYFPPIYYLEKLTLVAESQSQSADLS